MADNDPETVELLQRVLIREEYQVDVVTKAENVLSVAEQWIPDMIFLTLPFTRGKTPSLGRSLKNSPVLSNTLVVYLTDIYSEDDEIAAFEDDADAFLVKPLRPRALVERLRSMFNRRDHRLIETEKVVLGDLVLERSTHSVSYGSRPVPVAQKEFEILHLLARNPNRIFSREELIHEVWGLNVYVLTRTVDVHIHKLREKIGEEYISTVKGLGYRLNWKI